MPPDHIQDDLSPNLDGWLVTETVTDDESWKAEENGAVWTWSDVLKEAKTIPTSTLSDDVRLDRLFSPLLSAPWHTPANPRAPSIDSLKRSVP